MLCGDRCPGDRGPGGQMTGGRVSGSDCPTFVLPSFVVGHAVASKEEKWPQPANPEVLSRTDKTIDRQHSRIE